MIDKDHLLDEIGLASRAKGLKVESPSHVLGISGVRHTFDFNFQNGSAEHLLVDVESPETEVEEKIIMRSFVKTRDVGAKYLLITNGGMAQNARELSKLYRMDVYETGSPYNGADLINKIIKRLERRGSEAGPISGEKIEVSPKYLALLIDLLSDSFDNITDVMGESVGQMFFTKACDKAAKRIGPVRPGKNHLKRIARRLGEWGVDVKFTEKGQELVVELKCPYAAAIHPHLKSEKAICQFSEVVLGLVRLTDELSTMEENTLTADGAVLIIKRNSRDKLTEFLDSVHERSKSIRGRFDPGRGNQK